MIEREWKKDRSNCTVLSLFGNEASERKMLSFHIFLATLDEWLRIIAQMSEKRKY